MHGSPREAPLAHTDAASGNGDGDARTGDIATALLSRATGDMMGSHLSEGELRVWRTYLQAHALLLRWLEADLVGQTGISLAHYDVLVQLALADDHRLRMHELADRVLLSRSGITRVVDRLEADGLVERKACPSDARGAFAVLSDAGLTQLRQATPVHLAGVHRHFVEPLDDAQLQLLGELLERVVAALVSSAPVGVGRQRAESVPDPVAGN